MSASESDSMWLQKSIHLTDPIPDALAKAEIAQQNDDNEGNNRCAATSDGNTAPINAQKTTESEIELTKMPFNIQSARLMQSPSQRVSSRLSVPNTAFATLHEMDDLRARLSQMSRERLKWSNSQRDLEIARFELTQAREELKTMREYSKVIKNELDAANARADREVQGRQTLETQLNDVISQRESENSFLRQQFDALKDEQNERLTEIAEKAEVERNSRVDSLREQVIQMSETIETLEAQLAATQEGRARLQSEKEETQSSMASLQERCLELQRSIDGYAARCSDLEKMHTDFVAKVEKTHEETLSSQLALSEEQVHQLTVTKDEIIGDLQNELRAQKEKYRTISDELSTLRHRYSQLEDDLQQTKLHEEKEMKRLRDEHRLALSQQQLQTEVLVREAKGGRMSIEEEKSSLKRQLLKVSEELSTVTSILAQREKQISQMERELMATKDSMVSLEQKHIGITKEAEDSREALEHAEERVRRLMDQQDKADADYSSDLRDVKNLLAATKEELLKVKSELSVVVQEKIKEETENRSVISELREKLEKLNSEKSTLQHQSREKKHAVDLAEEYRNKYLSVCKKAENLDIELVAVTNRCALLEKRLDEEVRRSLKNISLSPTPDRRNGISAKRPLRSASSVNIPPLSNNNDQPMKKSRSVEPRVFTISGFEGSELLSQVKQLPYATVAECRSNAPVPSNLTHLVTNGQLTIKLLTALVRGCWILSEDYIHISLKEQRWLDEAAYGFRHNELPLANKRVCFTGGFASSRHYSTANLIASEGGAIMENDSHVADIVLCTHSEMESMETSNGVTWDKMVELIYPIKIGNLSQPH